MEHFTDRANGELNKDCSANLLADAAESASTFGGRKPFEKKAVPDLTADKHLPGIRIDVESRN